MEQVSAGKAQRVPKVAKVKNKAPAEIQITAEQLLREAKERDLEIVAAPPKQKISDPEELAAYRLRKRKAFEDNIRKNRVVMGNWLKYAKWEESQGEIQRTRSVYERALDTDHRNPTLWLRYAEMEMRCRQVNHARNLWDRAVTIMPRVNQFWYKYTYMEEMLGNIAGCRQVFERWMEWHPDEQAWQTYINFELRYKEIDRARSIYERFVYSHADVKHWIKYARFEEKHGFIRSARKVYERAVEFYGEEYMDERLFIAFAKFEENQREHERARVIYKYALEHIPKDKSQDLYKAYTIHEKKYGDRSGIESVITSKRKFQYEEALKENPYDYDTWFDYLKLLENADEVDVEVTRDTYERAIAQIPPAKEKAYWRRYIYLWLNYALFEELEVQDMDKARSVYKACLDLIPHKVFTFAKIWLLYAQFEVRQKNLQQTRKALGMAIGLCPKDKLFRGYIDLEIQLREFDRCRILYQKFLEFGPENCQTWMKFAELECLLGDIDRARAIYELAVTQPRLDMPEILWKTYIDFENEQGETERARDLYYRLLERTQHVKVWLSLSQFELGVADEECTNRARRVFEKANDRLRNMEKEERLMLLEGWRAFEYSSGDADSQKHVESRMPRRIKKRRKIETADGSEAGWEEYFDYIFPEDEAAKPNLKLLAMAKMWKKRKEVDGPADAEPQIISMGPPRQNLETEQANPDEIDVDDDEEETDEPLRNTISEQQQPSKENFEEQPSHNKKNPESSEPASENMDTESEPIRENNKEVSREESQPLREKEKENEPPREKERQQEIEPQREKVHEREAPIEKEKQQEIVPQREKVQEREAPTEKARPLERETPTEKARPQEREPPREKEKVQDKEPTKERSDDSQEKSSKESSVKEKPSKEDRKKKPSKESSSSSSSSSSSDSESSGSSSGSGSSSSSSSSSSSDSESEEDEKQKAKSKTRR